MKHLCMNIRKVQCTMNILYKCHVKKMARVVINLGGTYHSVGFVLSLSAYSTNSDIIIIIF